jgi:phosphoglucosamine mutase
MLINIRLDRKFDFAADAGITSAVNAAEKELAGQGRVLLRASGTEPLIRVMVEGRDSELVKSLAQRIAAVVKEAAAK